MTLQTYHRGLRDVKIASWNAANSYGTAYDVLGAREMSIEWVMETDELRGDDVVLDRFSKLVSVTFRLANAAVDLDLLDMLLGGSLVYNANYYDFMVGENDEVPYVAIAGRVVGSGGVGDLHMFVPKAKLAGNLQYSAQLDTYLIPQAQMQGVHEGTANGMLRFRNFVTPTALEIPLRTTTGFA
jgi:hypothetical protein